VWDIHAVAFVLSSFVLSIWIRKQYELGKDKGNVGYYSSDQLVIFPVHLKLLVALVVTSFGHGVLLLVFFAEEIVKGYSFATGNAVSFFASHVVIEGITFLLLSPGIGHRSMKKAALRGIAVGFVVGVSTFFTFLGEDKQKELIANDVLGDAVVFVWQGLLLLLYWAVWLAPNNGCGNFMPKRRPAALYWASFWAQFRLVLFVAYLLEEWGVDAGYCLMHVNVFVGFAVMKVWVAYRVFVLETKFWHGINPNGLGSPCLELANMCCGRTHDDASSSSKAMMKAWRRATQSFNADGNAGGEGGGSGGDSRLSVTHAQQSAITNPLEGVELSSQSAAAMSLALEELGHNTSHPSRQQPPLSSSNSTRNNSSSPTASTSSLSFASPPSASADASSSPNKPFPQRRPTLSSRLASTIRRVSINDGGRQGSSVPLIDFSRLKILPERLLGSGSTARVYEGRWCGKKCAVKVLFTVEIVPEEIRRTCAEASLLHSLQAVSESVVGLYGVAVLPPSLCVVLELCSEGSLGDVLFDQKLSLGTQSARELRASAAGGGGGRDRSGSSRGRSGSRGSRGSLSQRLSIGSGFGNFLRASLQRTDEDHRASISLRASNGAGASNSGGDGGGGDGQYEFAYALPWEHKLELAVGCCRGVAALCSALPGHSHNDIKSPNFLVNCPNGRNAVASGGEPTYFVKIADMEFASAGVTPEYMLRGDTPNWTAPEVLSGAAPVSPASDVYALANVLFEVAARQPPFATEFNPAVVAAHIKAGRRPEWPLCAALGTSEGKGDERAKRAACEVSSHAQFKAWVVKGWAQEASERPTAVALAEGIEALRSDYLAQLQELQQSRLFRSATSTAGSKTPIGAILGSTPLLARRKSQSQQQQQSRQNAAKTTADENDTELNV